LLEVREAVLRALEGLRKNKTIGSAQQAIVTISASPADLPLLEANRDLLITLCMVSELKIESTAPLPGDAQRFGVDASRSPYAKCERCWNLRPDVGQHAEHPTLCGRCARVVAEMGEMTEPLPPLQRGCQGG
jgi:isoleucyl-tRNA synthetase